MDEKGKKHPYQEVECQPQLMDEKGKQYPYQDVECQPNIWMRTQKKKTPLCIEG